MGKATILILGKVTANLTNYSQIRQSDFDEFSQFLLLHAFLDFFRKLKWIRATSVINPKLF